MDEEELVLKLIEHKNQQKGIEKMLQKDPANETLITLQKDLSQIISLTEKFIATKRKNTKSTREEKEALEKQQQEEDAGAVPKKEIPREWGVYKNDWKPGERCQVLYSDRRWNLAEITEIDDEGVASLMLLDSGNEYSVPCKRLRTYVPVLRDSIKKGDLVRAIWEFDGLFYDAKVLEINEDGTFNVLFEKYNHKDNVKLEDIQPKQKKVQKKNHFDFRDENGNIKEKFEVPEDLLQNDKDSEFVAQRKRKRIKQLRTEHKRLLAEENRLSKQKNWSSFHKSMQDNKFRPHKYERTKRSIFSTDIVGNIGVTDPTRMTKNPDQRKYHQLKVNPNE